MKEGGSFFYCKFSSNCSECCKETEMILSNADILRIQKLGYKRDYFTIEDNGFYKLKNKEGSCIFLIKGRCSIYEMRPEGCRYYPLVFDLENNCLVIDDDCPNKNNFDMRKYIHLKDKVLHFILRLFQEREEREK